MKTVLLVFAKAPITGEVKTRLGEKIGMEASKWVYEKLLLRTSQISKKSKLKTVVFYNKITEGKNPYFRHAKDHKVQ